MRKVATLLLLLAVAASAFCADTTESILKKASAQAKEQNKNVLVMFHASWCGWCHRLDDFLDKTDAGKLVKDSFVIVHITVMENDDHKADENPGGMDLLAKLGGDKGGIPFSAVISPAGKTLITSNSDPKKPSNIGFPVEDFEIAHFIKMLKTGTKLSEAQLNTVKSALVENAKKIKNGG